MENGLYRDEHSQHRSVRQYERSAWGDFSTELLITLREMFLMHQREKDKRLAIFIATTVVAVCAIVRAIVLVTK